MRVQTLLVLPILMIVIHANDQTNKIIDLFKKTVNSTSKKTSKNKQAVEEQMKWELQKVLFRQVVLANIEIIMDNLGASKESKNEAVQFADSVILQIYSKIDQLDESSKKKVKELIFNIPEQYQQLKENERQQLEKDFQYLQSIDQIKQEQLLSLISQNISQSVGVSQLSPNEQIKSIFHSIHDIISNDKKTPQPKYDIENNWDIEKFNVNDIYDQVNEYEHLFNNTWVDQDFQEFLQQNQSLDDINNILNDIFNGTINNNNTEVKQNQMNQSEILQVKESFQKQISKWHNGDFNEFQKNQTLNSSQEKQNSIDQADQLENQQKGSSILKISLITLGTFLGLISLILLYRKFRQIQLVNQQMPIPLESSSKQDNVIAVQY